MTASISSTIDNCLVLPPHPTREQIVDVMRSHGQPISATALARVIGKPRGAVAYHVRELAKAGVVELESENNVRGAIERFYMLADAAPDSALRDPEMSLLALCGALTVPGGADGYPRPVPLDAEARRLLSGIINKLQPAVRAIASASVSRAEGG